MQHLSTYLFVPCVPLAVVQRTTLFSHDINVASALARLLLPTFARRRRTEQVIDAARIAHARGRSARRSAGRRRRRSSAADVGSRAGHGRRASSGGHTRRSARWRHGGSRHGARWSAWWSAGRCGARRRGAADRARSAALGRWRRWLGGFDLLGARLLVDPTLQFGVVHEAVGLAQLGADGLVQVRGATARRNVALLAAAKPI